MNTGGLLVGHDLTIIVLTQRMFESPEAPPAHRDIQAAAYTALD